MKLLGTITDDKDIINKEYAEDNFQESLVSGTNIKTINNISILGSGNIEIGSGSGAVSDVQFNGSTIVSSGIANITLKDINGNSLWGSGTLSTDEVYVGTTSPTDPNVDVWIDTSGSETFIPTNYYGTEVPDSSIGQDGDLYILIES